MPDIPANIPKVSEFNSLKFKFWSFVSMFLLVFVHGYNLEINYLQPWTLPREPLTFTTFTEYFLANGIFRFRIPMLFIISGYLFAMHDYRPAGERNRKRLRTLLLPYLLWSALGLLLTYALEIIPFTRDIIAGSKIVQFRDQQLLLHDYHWYDLLTRWILVPVPYQLWFIRVLLIYNLSYPAIRWCISRPVGKWIFFAIALLMWLSTTGFFFVEGEGLLFFSLGVWMQKQNFNIDKASPWLNPRIWAIVFILLTSVKTVLAFRGEPLFGQALPMMLAMLHKLVVLSGLITAWYGCNTLVKMFMKRPAFRWMTSFSFMIYACHAPLVAFISRALTASSGTLPHARLLIFTLVPLAVISFSIGTGALLRSLTPRTYSLLTGGRGL